LRQPASSTLLLALGILAFPAPLRQADLPRDLFLVRNIKNRMRQNLARVPNYTCLETMVRTTRAPSSMIIAAPGKTVPFRKADVVRVEVAEVDGDELFASPGNHDFKKMRVRELAHGGLIGNGSFSLIAHDVFTTNVAVAHFVGEEKMDERILLKYDYRVSQLESGFQVGTERGLATVGYHGSVWANPTNFDAVRLDLFADDIPPYLGVDQTYNRIDYTPVRIGSSIALLPQSGELSMRRLAGWESRNEVTFTHCREYGVETTISFGDVTDASTPSTGTRDVELPAGLQLTIRLDTPVDSDKALVGDPISGKVDLDAKVKGKVVVHKDALVSGRLRRVEQHLEGFPYVLVRLEFTQIEFEGKTARFFAELEKIIPVPGSQAVKRVATKELPGVGGLPGVGTISAMGNRLVLLAGTQMIWKTLSYEQANGSGH
jgi:hypothetical protein